MENNRLDFQSILSKVLTSYEGNNDFTDVMLDSALEKTVRRVAQTKKKGVITLTLTVATYGNDQVAIDSKITTKLPENKHSLSRFYYDSKGNLSEEAPEEMEYAVNVRAIK